MKVRQAREYRVYPNKEQQQRLAVQFGHARYVYNRALANRKEHYKLYGDVNGFARDVAVVLIGM